PPTSPLFPYTTLFRSAESAEYIANAGALGNAIGGLSVGEPAEEMYEMCEIVTNILPKDKPRYLMGVGTPINILENIALGIDMFRSEEHTSELQSRENL